MLVITVFISLSGVGFKYSFYLSLLLFVNQENIPVFCLEDYYFRWHLIVKTSWWFKYTCLSNKTCCFIPIYKLENFRQ